jgi:hypothetical protein
MRPSLTIGVVESAALENVEVDKKMRLPYDGRMEGLFWESPRKTLGTLGKCQGSTDHHQSFSVFSFNVTSDPFSSISFSPLGILTLAQSLQEIGDPEKPCHFGRSAEI